MASHPTRFPRSETREGPPGPRGRGWTWLLLVPLLGTLFPVIYNTRDPELIGIPFFYWYQMLWIPLSVLCTLTVYQKTKRVIGSMTVFAEVNTVELSVFVFLFGLVSVLGFVAARWRRAAVARPPRRVGPRRAQLRPLGHLVPGRRRPLHRLHVRRRPALLFGAGALGFFAVPYTVIVYPMVFLVVPRLWSVSHRHGFVTPADFVRGRFGSPTLALLVAITGIVATMPYIALQLVGIEAVLKAMGILGEWPLIIAFAILAAYTYSSGLRAPALIAFVKDSLIYLVMIVAVIYIPAKLGGFGDIFAAADKKFAATPGARPTACCSATRPMLGYSTLAFGSALALFLYPHSVTGVLASRSRDTIKRNMAALPAYSLVLGLIALLGYMAIAAGIKPLVSGGKPDPNTVVPLLFDKMFPDWFAGVAFAAIGIGALVPAAIMSIAAANLLTRNIYKEYLNRDATPAQEARSSKLASLVVKVGAVS